MFRIELVSGGRVFSFISMSSAFDVIHIQKSHSLVADLQRF
jgi:hypothetical protein